MNLPSARSGLALCGAALLALAASGCSADDEVPDSVVAEFAAAVSSADYESACDLLTPSTRAEVEQDTAATCPDGLAGLDLPGAGSVLSSQVYGRAAFVQAEGDTLFLVRTGPSWAIRAAGCAAVTEAPFDCTVDGG